MAKIMGIRAEILRIHKQTYGDCSNNGISNRFNTVTIVETVDELSDGTLVSAKEVKGQCEPDDDAPAVRIVKRISGDKWDAGLLFTRPDGVNVYLFAQVIGAEGRGVAGGTFIFTTDSRFTVDISHYPISLHDRFEG